MSRSPKRKNGTLASYLTGFRAAEAETLRSVALIDIIKILCHIEGLAEDSLQRSSGKLPVSLFTFFLAP